MACTDPCSCCHGACCIGGECEGGLNCFDCEANGGEWQGAESNCDSDPCDECAIDADCNFCELTGERIEPTDPCPDGWNADGGNCNKKFLIPDCDDCNSTNYPAPDGLTDYAVNCQAGYCCGGTCQEEPCETGCPCSYRGAGYTLAYVENDTGYEICCPPGTTWNSGDELCDCEDDDPQCTPGTPWYVSPSGPDDFVNCGDFCVKIPEECPP